MVSPRIWVSCAADEDAQQSKALAQQLISDLRTAGAEVVSESATLPDEQFLPLLQRELAGCQWFILVQTPQGMSSRRVRLAIQEARSYLKKGLLCGACLVNASSDGWDEPASWPEMRSYIYTGDYPRLRDKLLLDLDLLQITSLPGEERRNAMAGMLPLVQETSDFQPQAVAGRAERLAPFQERSTAMNWSPSSFQSQRAQKATGGDRPVPLRFSLPRPSRRAVIGGLAVLLASSMLVAFLVTGGLGFNANHHANQPQAKAQATPTTQPTQGQTVPQPTLTSQQPTQPPLNPVQNNLTVQFTNLPAQLVNGALGQATVQTLPGATVQFDVMYAGAVGNSVVMQQVADNNGMATFNWNVQVVQLNNNVTATLTAIAIGNNGQQTQSQATVIVLANQ